MKYVVTSALPYVNNIPHLGNLICIISADVHQRFLKNQGKDVLSILGTDEHGTTTERIAIEEGKNPKSLIIIEKSIKTVMTGSTATSTALDEQVLKQIMM